MARARDRIRADSTDEVNALEKAACISPDIAVYYTLTQSRFDSRCVDRFSEPCSSLGERRPHVSGERDPPVAIPTEWRLPIIGRRQRTQRIDGTWGVLTVNNGRHSPGERSCKRPPHSAQESEGVQARVALCIATLGIDSSDDVVKARLLARVSHAPYREQADSQTSAGG